MSDLYLTDDQVTELSTMGLVGKMAADELRLWRDADDAYWYSDLPEGAQIYNECCADSGPVKLLNPAPTASFEKENAKAICHARNTAELRAAAAYWGLERRRMGHALDLNKYRSKQVDVTEEKCVIAIKNLFAINEAYMEMKE